MDTDRPWQLCSMFRLLISLLKIIFRCKNGQWIIFKILLFYICIIYKSWDSDVSFTYFQHVDCGLSLPWSLKNFVFLSECWNLVFRFRSRLLCCLTVTLVAFLTAGWLKCPTVKHIFCSSNISLTTFIHFYFFSSASFLSDPLFKSKENEEGEYKEKDKKTN